MRNSSLKFWLDIAMGIAFCLLFNPRSTGLAFHEIAGLVLGGAIIVHVLLNKNWLIGISKKIFSKDLNWQTRFSYLLNLILFIDLFFITLSGLLISKIVTPNFRIFTSVNWMPIHIFSSILGLVIVGVHIGLHWNWIKQMGSQVPKLTKMISFNMRSLKLASIIMLIFGTIFLSGQVSKMISIAPSMFSNPAIRVAQGLPDFKKHGDLQQADNPNGQKEQNREGRKGKNSHGHEDPLSISQLAGNIPNLILYSSALGSMAFYTYLLAKRAWNQR